MVDEEHIVRFVRSRRYKPMTSGQLADRFSTGPAEQAPFSEMLRRLELEGKIVRLKGNCWEDPQRAKVVVGRLHCHPDGFGFVIAPAGEKDAYVADNRMADAMHNDVVVAEIRPSQHRGRRSRRGRLGPEGRIVRVLQRANEKVIGAFVPAKGFGRVTPDNPSLFRDIHVPAGREAGAARNDKVVVKITSWPGPALHGREAEGDVIRVLGPEGAAGADVQYVIHQFNLPDEFPPRVLREAADMARQPAQQEKQKRRDFRGYTTVTVDPEEARDRDDALSLYREPRTGHRVVLVHIADVSRYVHPDSPLDVEARKRGCSVYLVSDFVPMLPKDVTRDVLSFAQDQERLAKTVVLEFDDEANLINSSICHSVVNVNEVMTYTDVKEVLKAAGTGNGTADQTPSGDCAAEARRLVVELDELAAQLRAGRHTVGSLDLDVPDYDVQVDEDGHVTAVSQIERDRSHDLVEEFMLCANRVVARFLNEQKLPCVYRIHDKPEEEALLEFARFALHTTGKEVNPLDRSQLQDLLAEVADTPLSEAINLQLLRAMKKAVYHPHSRPHFALHFDTYCHFTSPIRRYPDLAVHQILDQYFAGKMASQKVRGRWDDLMPEIARDSSHCEQRADEAEREIVKLKLLRFLEEHPDARGATLDAVITGVHNYGFFAQLQLYSVDGLVKLESLKDDVYRFDEGRRALIGTRTGRTFELGQVVKVLIDNIDVDRRRMDLVPAQ